MVAAIISLARVTNVGNMDLPIHVRQFTNPLLLQCTAQIPDREKRLSQSSAGADVKYAARSHSWSESLLRTRSARDESMAEASS